jgi:hypothetical protein
MVGLKSIRSRGGPSAVGWRSRCCRRRSRRRREGSVRRRTPVRTSACGYPGAGQRRVPVGPGGWCCSGAGRWRQGGRPGDGPRRAGRRAVPGPVGAVG